MKICITFLFADSYWFELPIQVVIATTLQRLDLVFQFSSVHSFLLRNNLINFVEQTLLFGCFSIAGGFGFEVVKDRLVSFCNLDEWHSLFDCLA